MRATPVGEFVERSRQTVREYLERWLPAIRGTVEPSTWESYERNVQNHLLPSLSDIPLQALTPDDLSDLYATLAESGRRDGRGGLSARTVQYCHVILHRALVDAVRRGSVVRNVADYALAPAPKRTRRSAEMTTWTASEVAAFLDATRNDRLYVVWHVALMTGMRRGEVLGLRWRDCDLEAGVSGWCDNCGPSAICLSFPTSRPTVAVDRWASIRTRPRCSVGTGRPSSKNASWWVMGIATATCCSPNRTASTITRKPSPRCSTAGSPDGV